VHGKDGVPLSHYSQASNKSVRNNKKNEAMQSMFMSFTATFRPCNYCVHIDTLYKSL